MMNPKESFDEEAKVKAVKMPYVFGSSTPREFSYLDHIPAKYRIYNVRMRSSRRSREEPGLVKEVIRNPSPTRRLRDRSVDSAARIFVFGSSTPRELSYLERVPHEFRVYDVKLGSVSNDKRSKTTSFTGSGVAGRQNLRRSSSMSSTLGSTINKPERVSASSASSSAPSKHRSKDNALLKARNDRTRSVPASAAHRAPMSIDAQKLITKRQITTNVKEVEIKNKATNNIQVKKQEKPKEKVEKKKQTTVTNVTDVSKIKKEIIEDGIIKSPTVLETVQKTPTPDRIPSPDLLKNDINEQIHLEAEIPLNEIALPPDEIEHNDKENAPAQKYFTENVSDEIHQQETDERYPLFLEQNLDEVYESKHSELEENLIDETNNKNEGDYSESPEILHEQNISPKTVQVENEVETNVGKALPSKMEEETYNYSEPQHEEVSISEGDQQSEIVSTREESFSFSGGEGGEIFVNKDAVVEDETALDESTDETKLEHENQIGKYTNVSDTFVEKSDVIDRSIEKVEQELEIVDHTIEKIQQDVSRIHFVGEESNFQISNAPVLQPENETYLTDTRPYEKVEHEPAVGDEQEEVQGSDFEHVKYNNTIEPDVHQDNSAELYESENETQQDLFIGHLKMDETQLQDSEDNEDQNVHENRDQEFEEEEKLSVVDASDEFNYQTIKNNSDFTEEKSVDLNNRHGSHYGDDSSVMEVNEDGSDTAEPENINVTIAANKTENVNFHEPSEDEISATFKDKEKDVNANQNYTEEIFYNPDLKNIILNAFDCQNANATLADVYQIDAVEDRKSDVSKLIDNSGAFRPELYSQISEEPKKELNETHLLEEINHDEIPKVTDAQVVESDLVIQNLDADLSVPTDQSREHISESHESDNVSIVIHSVSEEISSDKSSEEKHAEESSDEKGFETDDESESVNKYADRRPITPPKDECRFVEDVGVDSSIIPNLNEDDQMDSTKKFEELAEHEASGVVGNFNLEEISDKQTPVEDGSINVMGIFENETVINNITLTPLSQDANDQKSVRDQISISTPPASEKDFVADIKTDQNDTASEMYYFLYDWEKTLVETMEKIYSGLDDTNQINNDSTSGIIKETVEFKDKIHNELLLVPEKSSDVPINITQQQLSYTDDFLESGEMNDFEISGDNNQPTISNNSLFDKIGAVANNFVQQVFNSEDQLNVMSEIIEGIQKVSPREECKSEILPEETHEVVNEELTANSELKFVGLEQFRNTAAEPDEAEGNSESCETSESIESPDTFRHLHYDVQSPSDTIQQNLIEETSFNEPRSIRELQQFHENNERTVHHDALTENSRIHGLMHGSNSDSSLSSREDEHERPRNFSGDGHSIEFYQKYKGHFQQMGQSNKSDEEV